MKALIQQFTPFALAHGGQQVQIEQTCRGLREAGVEVEFLRWWDGTQAGDILHFFERAPLDTIEGAHRKGMKVVMTELLTEQGSRSRLRLKSQQWVSRLLKKTLPVQLTGTFDWDAYRLADACIANTAWEAELMMELFNASAEKVHVLPNGVEEEFLQSQPVKRGQWLICVGTLTARKRMVELAEAAIAAQTPVWVVGKAYSENDPHAARFIELAKQHPQVIRFEGPIAERSRLAAAYREARGFVLLSAMETRSLSAEEAAACECPLLLSDLPWAKSVFGDRVSYCPVTRSTGETAAALRRFYDAAPDLKPPGKPVTWVEVGRQLKGIYEAVLKTSR